MSLYNLRNPAVKRLMKEAEELCHPTDEYYAQPLEDNLFEWHFTLRGPPNSDYDGGIYHGRITLPPDYPMKPPSIILLTPNGRFETNKKICLSISGHHPESWQPSWSIRTALLAIIGFMPTHGNGAIGSLDYTPEERKQLALKSQEWQCSECGHIKDIFFKKKYYYLRDETQSATLATISEILDVGLSNTITPLTVNNAVSELPETSVLKIDHSMSATEDNNSVHHRKCAANQILNEPEQTSSDSPKSNNLTSMCIWLIVFAIIILCFRRLFSL